MAGIEINSGVINYGGVPSAGAGLLANRPAAGITGRLFIGTDTNSWYRDTGSAWVTISAGVSGSAAVGQATYWSSATTISGDNAFFWDNTNKRLGIGTNTPGVKLDVHGAGVIQQLNGTGTNNAYLDFQNAGSTQWRIGNFYNGLTQQFSIFNAAGSTNTFSILQNGFVGINVATPLYQLDVRTNNSIVQNNYFQNSTSITNLWTDAGNIELLNNLPNVGNFGAGAGIRFVLSSTYNPIAGIFALRESTTASALTFYTQLANNSVLEKMRITSAGFVGISNTSPQAMLHITAPLILNQQSIQASWNGVLGFTATLISTTSYPYSRYDFFNGYVRVNGGTGTDAFNVYRGGASNYLRVEGDNNAAYDIAQYFTDGTNSVYCGMMRASSGVANSFSIYTGGSVRINTLSTGQTGFGYNSPSVAVAVNGSIYQGSNTANALYEMFCNGNLYTGGISPTILTVGTNTTMVRTVTGYRCTATLTLTLPVASGLNNMYYIIANTGATVTVQRNGTDIIIDKTGASVTSVTVAAGSRSMFYVGGGTEIFQIF